MDALVKKRSTIKAQLTRFGQFLDNSVNSPSFLDELRVRLPKAEQLIDKFEDIQQDIELEDTSDAQQVERETFESNYYKTIGKAKSFTNYNQEDIPIQIKNVDQRPESKLHLPVLNLPSFDGSFDDWFPFSDMFSVMIHNNKSLTDIEKLHYLKSCLKKEAFNVISSLELTSTNYEVAWTLIQERYNNKTLIIQKHVHSLFNLPKLDKESVQSLRELINSSTKHIHALKALGEPTDNWDTLLIHLISSKFDHLTFRDWQDTLSPNKLPTMQDLNDFLNHRFHILDTIYYSSKRSSGIVPFPKHNDNNVVKHKDNVLPNKSWTSSRQPCLLTYDPKCELCQSSHLLFQCEHFLNLSVPDRISKVRSLNLCTNCLKCHQTNQCRSKSGCKTCGKRHNTLLCLRSVSVTKDNCVQSNSQPHTLLEDNKQVLSVGSTANLHTSSTQTILSTAIVDIISSSGKIVSCKALLDCGSQSNFISESLCKRLQLNKRQTAVSITGINCTATSVNYIVNATVKSRVSQFNAHMEFLVLSKLTEKLPGNVLVDYSKKVPSNVSLADPSYHIPSKIDMILGAQVFWDVLCNETIKLSVNGPSLRETKLGWIFTGNNEVSKQISDSSQTYFVSSLDSLNSNIQRFWELEDCQSQSPLTGDDLLCEQHYQTTTMRDSNGRYIVKIPLKEDVSVLGDSKSMAIKRFASLESKLDKNPKLYNDYRDFMLEYENLGHMKFIGELNSVIPHEDSISYFIPHHAVIKESSTTTKLRVVFDASAKSSNGLSLNDISMNGPRVQDELFSIISRFRMHKYVFTADIEKMYRQIQIDSSQCSMQSILWRSHKSVPLKIFQLNTVTYGTKSAPFLATRTLQQLALDESQNFPIAHKSLLNDFYVDDVLSGAHTIESALHLQKELTELLKKGGFHLRKWSSNHVDLLANIPHSDIQAHPLHNFDMNSPIVKTLGLMWDTAQDVFKYSVSQDIQSHNITKRQVLSEIAKIFDPLGLIGPVILSAKLIMQKLWRENLDWNDELPSQLNNQWCDFYTSLTQLNELSINRYALSSNKPSSIELHGFCDGSMAAYGACVYLRCQDEKGQINVTLISSKSRVAPLKVISLPRLELCAALVLCQLTQVLIKALNIDVNNVYYYSDSTIVLSWINSPSSHYNTFVANRVATIQSLTDSRHWNHVAGTENPADLVSRGCLVQPLLSSTLWWNGPQWLSEEHQFWKEGSNFQPDTNVTSHPELRKVTNVTAVFFQVHGHDIFNRYSSLQKLLRVVAYCLRFCKNAKSKTRLTGPLTYSELNESRLAILKLAQSQSFPHELKGLTDNNCVNKSSKLLQLNPFLDDKGLIRVGGRLKNSDLSVDMKHPIALDHKHRLTRLIAEDLHIQLLHAGPQLLLNSLREQYWPLNGRSLVRSIVHSCVKCFKAKPKITNQLMGQLPQNRVQPSRPFSYCGLDYFGPVYIHSSNNKKTKVTKAYVSLFICLTTKAIHIELVEDLTTDAFIGALKRFISRRGKPVKIYSDNAKTFVGADKELHELRNLWISENHQNCIQSILAEQTITWSFIPPHSPNFGGLWESGVRIVKYHMKRIIQNTKLTFNEMYTLLVQIEACVNSRPLTPLSSDPNDLTPLTPAHFLIGSSFTSTPEPSLTELKLNKLSRWQHVQQLSQHFWNRWSKEYLNQLQKMSKWNITKPNIKIGDIMLIEDKNLLPCSWNLGRVIELHPGKDNLVRVVTLKTKNGFVKRSISKLCPLPID